MNYAIHWEICRFLCLLTYEIVSCSTHMIKNTVYFYNSNDKIEKNFLLGIGVQYKKLDSLQKIATSITPEKMLLLSLLAHARSDPDLNCCIQRCIWRMKMFLAIYFHDFILRISSMCCSVSDVSPSIFFTASIKLSLILPWSLSAPLFV